MVVWKIGLLFVWLVVFATVTILVLDHNGYAKSYDRPSRMAAAIALGFFWPLILIVGVATSPVWGMIVFADWKAKERHRKRT